MKEIGGMLDGSGKKFAIIVSRFNDFITERLLGGAVDCLVRHKTDNNDITVYRVPGAWEIPLVAKKAAASGKFDGVICLGAVIRGETPHFDYVCAEASKGIAQASLATEVPIAFGILTTDDVDQAISRAGTKSGNKGWEAALSTLEMVDLLSGM